MSKRDKAEERTGDVVGNHQSHQHNVWTRVRHKVEAHDLMKKHSPSKLALQLVVGATEMEGHKCTYVSSLLGLLSRSLRRSEKSAKLHQIESESHFRALTGSWGLERSPWCVRGGV